jgi:hypothetical protein
LSATPRPLWTARILAILPFLLFAAFIVFALLRRSFDMLPETARSSDQPFTTAGLTICMFYAFPVSFVFGLLGLHVLGIAYFSTVFAYSCALSYAFYWRRPEKIFSMSATVGAAISGGFAAFLLLGLGFTSSPPEALWVPITGLLVAGFFSARSPKSFIWLLTLCLSAPSLFFTIQSTGERFLRHQADAWHFDLLLSAGIFFAALIGTCLGKLSLRFTRKI